MATTRELANTGSQQALGAIDQKLSIGSKVYGSKLFEEGAVATNIMVLTGAKASLVLGGFASAGTNTGPLIGVAADATLAAGQVTTNANGDILFFATDAVTRAEIEYLTIEGDRITEQVVVASDTGALQQSKQGRQLISVTSDAGTTTGLLTNETRGVAPGAGEAALNAAGTDVLFNAADAVTLATLVYIATPGIGSGVGDTLSELLDETFPST